MTQTALLVFARAAGLAARAPALGHPSVPRPVRAGFALALAFAVAPGAAQGPALEPVAFALALGAEFGLGAAMGAGAALLCDGAYFAGRALDEYLGIRGSFPGANVVSAQGFGRLWSSAFLAAFVLLDGWVPVVDAFAGSFAHVRAGTFVAAVGWLRYGLALPATTLQVALAVAGPAIAVGAAVQLAVAAVARVVPRFSGFTLAVPLAFAAALLVTIASIPLLAPLGARPELVAPWSVPR